MLSCTDKYFLYISIVFLTLAPSPYPPWPAWPLAADCADVQGCSPGRGKLDHIIIPVTIRIFKIIENYEVHIFNQGYKNIFLQEEKNVSFLNFVLSGVLCISRPIFVVHGGISVIL